MSILYPAALDGTTQFPQPQGTALLTSPDHALLHTNTSILGTAIEGLIGTTAAANGLFNSYLSGQTPLPINSGTLGTIVSKGTLNNLIVGSQTATGGTFNQIIAGSPTVTGGTILGSINGAAGTFQTPTINGGTYGTLNSTGDLISIPLAGSVMQGGYVRQGGTVTDYSVVGTTQFNETGVFIQFGVGSQSSSGTPAAGGTVIFPIAFSKNPLVTFAPYGTQSTLPCLNTIALGSFTWNSERPVQASLNWIAIGKR